MNFAELVDHTIGKFQQTIQSFPETIIILGCLILLLVFILCLLIFFSHKKPGTPKTEGHKIGIRDRELPPLGGFVAILLTLKGYFRVNRLSLSFLKIIQFLREYFGQAQNSQIPWFLVVGAEGSGKTCFLQNIGLSQPAGQADFYDGVTDPDCRWWFFNHGILLDLKGIHFLAHEPSQTQEQILRNLLILLSRYRGGRPLSGLVLTVSVKEFYGSEKLSPEEIYQRADQVTQKIVLIQQSLGLQFPIYVVLTQTDTIPGFQNFCQLIPDHNKHNMLGWSSPYSFQQMYSSQWLDAAFSWMEDLLTTLRLEIFASSSNERQMDGVFVFPQELLRIKPGLSIYLNRIFKPESYQSPPILRGIYWCGDGGESSPHFLKDSPFSFEASNSLWSESSQEIATTFGSIEPVSSAYSHQRNICFVTDLFTHKIFPEHTIAAPQPTRVITLNKGMNTLKFATTALVVVGSYSMIHSFQNFRRQKDNIIPVLDKIMNVLQELEYVDVNSTAHSSALFDVYARELLLMMEEMQSAHFFSLMIPASWGSSINQDLAEGFRIVYQQTVMRTIYIQFLLKAKELINLRPIPSDHSKNLGELLSPLTCPEYRLLKHYVQSLIKLYEKINKFNNIKGAPDVSDFEDLIQYTFHAPLPERFKQQYKKFRSLLVRMDLPTIDLLPYQQIARETLSRLYQNFLNALFVEKYSFSLSARLNQLVYSLKPQAHKSLPSFQDLSQVSRNLTEAIHQIGKPGQTWLDGDYFSLGLEFENLLDDIDSFRLFGKEVTQYLVDKTAIAFDKLKENLRKINQVIFEEQSQSISKTYGVPSQSLSSGIFVLEKVFANLFNQIFMDAASDFNQFETVIPEEKMIHWDPGLIHQAYDMVKKFDEFQSTQIPNIPLVIQDSIRVIAQYSLQKNIMATLAKAQTLVDKPRALVGIDLIEEILKTKIGEFKVVSAEILKLLDTLSEDTVGIALTNLQRLLVQSTLWFLKKIDQMFQEFNPYAMKTRDFSWWDGKTGASVEAYGVQDLTDLKSYLDLQRQYVENLTFHFAQPIIGILQNPSLSNHIQQDLALVTKWRRIVEQVKLCRKKVPDNSIAQLEKFLVEDLNTITTETSFTKINVEGLRDQSGDFFIQSLNDIKRRLLERSEVVIRKKSIRHYDHLLKFFNRSMKGLFPFVPIRLNLDTNLVQEVDPEVIKSFFKLYDQFGGAPEKILDQVYQLGGSGQRGVDFLKKMAEIKQFFRGFIEEQSEDTYPVFDSILKFRTHRAREVGANLIVDFSFKASGDSAVHRTDSLKTLRWTFGQGMEVGFRWPRLNADFEVSTNAPVIPQPRADAGQKNLMIDGQKATFGYPGKWGLLWMVLLHRVPSIPQAQGVHLLKFSIPIEANTKDVKQAVVYHTIELSIPPLQSKQPGQHVKIPYFPTFIPNLEEDVTGLVEKPVLVNGLLNPSSDVTEPEEPEEPEEETEAGESNSSKADANLDSKDEGDQKDGNVLDKESSDSTKAKEEEIGDDEDLAEDGSDSDEDDF
jgi:type VI secretion system protein ImpL